MNVTQEILNNRKIYGGGAGQKPHELAVNRSLNYASGGTIQKAVEETVRTAGYSVIYSDSIGLMGAENKFIKFNVNIIDTGNFEISDSSGYYDAMDSDEVFTSADWDSVIYNVNAEDSTVVNTYSSAVSTASDELTQDTSYIEVTLDNLKTSNHYIDNWLDVTLYSSIKEEHPYDKMFLALNDSFYIGFHARTTKRIPYNVKCVIGSNIVLKDEMTEDQKAYLPRLYT